MILNQPVNFGGRLYAKGENVQGKLPPDFLAVLQANGAIADGEDEEVQDSPTASLDNSDEPLTLQALGELLPTLTEVADVEALLEKEQAREQPRSGAVKQISKRLEELREE